MNPPVLGHLNLNFPFLVYTNASEVGLGLVLLQQTELGNGEILAYGSCSLNQLRATTLPQNLSVWLWFGLRRGGEFTWREACLRW